MEAAAKEATGEPDAVDVEARIIKTVDRIDRLVDSAPINHGGQQQINRIVLEGAGKPVAWLSAGLAIGVALGAAVACAGWVAFTLNNIQEDVRNNEAFIQATYQQAPELRERFDKIKADQEKPQ